MKPSWKIRLTHTPFQASLINNENENVGLLDFESLEALLEYLSMQPRNKVKILNPDQLQKWGAPLVRLGSGRISITSTIRNLMPIYNEYEIARRTGFPLQTIFETTSRLKKQERCI